MFGKTGGFGTHPEDRQYFLVGHDLRFYVRRFFRRGEILPLVQFPEVFVNGNQHVLNKFNIAEVLLYQSL